MSTCKVYYLAPDGSLCAVEEPGHCDWYWTLYRRFLKVANRATHTVDDDQLKAAEIIDAQNALSAHVEICDDCRAWLDRCEARSLYQAAQEGEAIGLPVQLPALISN